MNNAERVFFGMVSFATIAVTSRNLAQARRSGRVEYGHCFGRRLFAERRMSLIGFRATIALNVFILVAGFFGNASAHFA